jgi:sulfide:quinone oxidoreductase
MAYLIDFDYTTEPLPGKFPFPGLGPFSLLGESQMNYVGNGWQDAPEYLTEE